MVPLARLYSFHEKSRNYLQLVAETEFELEPTQHYVGSGVIKWQPWQGCAQICVYREIRLSFVYRKLGA
jgi:hypothetical protein